LKLIREEIEDVEFLAEEKNGKKSFYIKGPFLAADCVNRNKRCYESRILDPAVNRYIKENVDTGRALGELSHPEGPQINLDRVSHRIVDLHKEGNYWMGKARILDTPMGRIASSLLNDGVKLGVSSRGMGSLVERNGINYVGEDYYISTCADLVSDPSGPDCFVQGIMEGKEWFYDTEGKLRAADVARHTIESHAFTGTLTEEAYLKVFARYLQSL
jgi:hypothetical protein